MATNRKRTPRSRKETGLTGAEEKFLYGKTDKPVNRFEWGELKYAHTPKRRAKIEALQKLKSMTIVP